MNVSLTPELEKFVSAKVGSGRYSSTSEVVREALRLLDEHDSPRAARNASRHDRRCKQMDYASSTTTSAHQDPPHSNLSVKTVSAELCK
jgi:antitoxin ParD1/3/4